MRISDWSSDVCSSDLQTRRPFDFDGFALSATGRGIYNETSDTLNPNLSLLVSDRWETGIGDIGLMVNGSYARTKYRDMSITAGALVPFATTGNLPQGSRSEEHTSELQ